MLSSHNTPTLDSAKMIKANETRKTSMRDIARISGTSTSTVSRVLNGGYVSAETRAGILSAMEKLNYSPKYLPNRLSRVCVLLRNGFATPYSDRILPALSQKLTQEKLQMLVLSETEGEESWMLQSIRDLRPEILVCLGRLTQGYLSLEPELKGIVQVSDWKTQHPSLKVVYFAEDMRAYGELGVAHLHKLGHRHILLVHRGYTHAGSQNLFHGVKGKVESLGMRLSELTIPSHERSGSASMTDKIPQLLNGGRDRPTACILARSAFTLPLWKVLHDHGIVLPKDFSVIGREDENRSSDLNPPLTSFRHDHEELSRLVSQAINKLLKGDPGQIKSARVQPTLIERGSVGPVPHTKSII
jgi:DNA-binding LacI/PurR family transcriptional regulator